MYMKARCKFKDRNCGFEAQRNFYEAEDAAIRHEILTRMETNRIATSTTKNGRKI
jgi:hypothetical protein